MNTEKKSIKRRPKNLSVSSLEMNDLETSSYETDFSKWANDQARFLKKREFSKLDIKHLIEEIEDLSKREKQRLTSYLEILLMHMLKAKYQPEKHSRSWDLSIKEANYKAQKALHENPSLKSKLKEIVDDAYFSARIKAILETGMEEKTFPETHPWKLKDIFPDLEKKYC